jgi:hypothetical protein
MSSTCRVGVAFAFAVAFAVAAQPAASFHSSGRLPRSQPLALMKRAFVNEEGSQ